MRVALIGYGAMGQLIAQQAKATNDEIGENFTSKEAQLAIEEMAKRLSGHDVAVDFSNGSAVTRNVEACVRAGVPLVEGTTGWKENEALVRSIVKQNDGALVYGANFSVGVNVFYRIVERASELFASLSQYEAFIEEQHHSRKKDAPSGTALNLKNLMDKGGKPPVSVASTRAGEIPGTHRVGFDSAADQITVTHMARSREGFAAGALMAARWIKGRKGVYEFSEVINEILGKDSV
ncbi:MAG TPA: dihydrodipicolinate reductase C-terminal domain-containing protein [Pyrinomonadaceae bacterium]|nr:dihydrodipicolinate reductase C-terminal domain-containing protein [Pyrinomonadaceae bacterium]